MNRFRNWVNGSIQHRMVAWGTAFWVVSLSVLAITLILSGQSRLMGEASHRNTQLASVISREVSSQISGIFADARNFARHLEIIDPRIERQAEAVLALRLASPQRYRAAYYFDSRDNLVFHIAEPPGDLVSLKDASAIVTRAPVPISEAVIAIRDKADHGTSISDEQFTGIDRLPVVYLGIPVEPAGGDERVLVLEIDLRDVWQRIDMLTVGRSGFAYMVSRQGRVVAHPNPASIGREIPSAVQPLLSGIEGSATHTDPDSGKAVLAAFSPVGGQTGWGIVIQQDNAEVMAAISGTVVLTIAVWLILAIAGTAAISLMIKNFSRPIVDLTDTAQEIARTREFTRTALPQRSDEVGRLGQAFDQMIDHLQSADREIRKAQEDLENRVTARTSELEKTNALLEEEIAQRGQIEEALRQSEVKYRHLIESANTIILEIDTDGRVTYFNRFAEEFFGFKQAEILGKSVIGTIVPRSGSSGDDLQAMISAIVANPELYRHNENENMLRSGKRVRIVWTNQPLYDDEGHLREILCVGFDVTEQRKNEELKTQQLRDQAAANERTRLARDLHDAVSQTLFSASLVAEVLPRLWEKDPDEGRRRLREIRELTRGALAEMRTLLFELRPAALADVELGDLLQQLAESVTGRARVPVNVEIQGSSTCPTDTKIGLYRIAQEALNNVAKHSGADGALVSLQCQPNKVEMHIVDSGRGFELSKARGKSLGLGIMNERAAAIGARLEIKSEIDHGTEITVVWPSQ